MKIYDEQTDSPCINDKMYDDNDDDYDKLTTLVIRRSLDGPTLSCEHPPQIAFNTNAIVYDNTPWQPGRDIDTDRLPEDERKLKNLATRVMSNGVEVLFKDKNGEVKPEQRKLKVMHLTSMKPPTASTTQKKSLLSSAVATVINHQQISALLPLHQLMQHNYIIKTCMTTYTYLTTVVQNKRSAISTFETIVSVVTTESLTNYQDLLADLKPTKTKYMEVKTIQPSVAPIMYGSNFAKIDKRIDSSEDDNYDLIQPSEVSHIPCTSTSCPCSHTKTESLKTKYTNIDATTTKYAIKSSKYGTKVDLKPTNKDDMNTKYPYEYESTTQLAPIDKIVEKYTEVMNDYSDEKDSNAIEMSELLTNEQAPSPTKINKVNKQPEKKPEKPPKTNKNKFVVADLLKLGSLGIQGLTQLAPVIEKMTGSFIKKHDTVQEKTTTTTIKPVEKLIAYNANKRVDSEIESKHSSFPIYIPVDEMETSESQLVFTNATLHQNLAWAAEHKHPKLNIVPHRIIHESPLVNGGIPISPGEIITAHSDVIVGKPAVGGPLTLAASGFKLHNPVNPPPLDSFVAANEEYRVKERPMNDQPHLDIKVDDSYDLRPPELPRPKPNRPLLKPRPSVNNDNFSKYPYRMPNAPRDDEPKITPVKPTNPMLVNHGRPAYLDYIPSLASVTEKYAPIKHHVDFNPAKENIEDEVPDNSPSSSEIVNSHIRTEEKYTITSDSGSNKPFLVDIQPSRVANVLIPHGSSTAIVFAGSSEPHKTGDYIDDPLPYPEPGYFGSFSIDAPQMTNVHNVAPNNKPFLNKPTLQSHLESHKPNTHLESYKPTTTQHKDHLYMNDLKLKWKDNKRPIDINKLPPPTSNQETHVQVGPKITAYNPDIYNPSNVDFDNYSNVNKGNDKHKKEIIDKEYENYLAVPPPPPKMVFNQENKNKPYNQRPIVQTKPVQDMKVFLNVQHPIPDQLPPKVTSEIYFAAQTPYSKQTPTYTINIPPATQPSFSFNKQQISNIPPSKIYSGSNNIHNSFPIAAHNVANKSILAHDLEKENTYTVTLNTATNVANNVNDVGQVLGTSVPVALGNNPNNGALNADIPIGTNFAIRVEDNTPSETYNLQQGNRNPIVYDQSGRVPNDFTIEDNRWNKSSTDLDQNTIIGHNYRENYSEKPVHLNIQRPTTMASTFTVRPSMTSSLNSHANFPMMNEQETYHNQQSTSNQNIKPVFDKLNVDVTTSDPKRPGKYIPNIPTNSHGWYSSVLVDHNNIKNIDIKTESSTRKVIPLIHNIEDKDRVPTFGQKVASAGKPPTEFWAQTKPNTQNVQLNNGKPFAKPQSTINQNVKSVTNKPIDQNNYVISNFGSIKQPAYDIPIRDNSDETTTLKSIKHSIEELKPVYETAEEIYDGEEETVEVDGEVSSESMKIPVVSSSLEIQKPAKSSTELTLLQDEILEPMGPTTQSISTTTQSKPNPNLGSQTEKPFGSFNKTSFQSNSMKPIYGSNPFSKPRPFTMGTSGVLDHQLQQPHWQINDMMVNSTNISYEENLDLNLGEEMSSPSTAKLPITNKPPYGFGTETDIKYKNPRPARPHLNNTRVNNSGIITSTVHIKDKKPLMVEKNAEKTTLPTFTIPNELGMNITSSEIIDLSPPPPTIDYSFKPSTKDEMIMGMSPPPPRNSPGLRQPPRAPLTPRPTLPARTPPTHGIKPPRTIPPRLPPQRPTRKPIRDDISTYRPAYDILNNIRRPTFNRDQPSSLLLPPPREIPLRGSQFVESPSTTVSAPNIVFPTPISSGWLTSSGIEFSSSFNFAPTSIQFPETTKPSQITESYETPVSESIDSYENEYSSEQNNDQEPVKPNTEDRISNSKEASTQATTKRTSTEINDSHADESSYEQLTTDKIKVIPMNKNRTRKPYPFRHDDRKTSSSKFKPPVSPTQIIRPTRTLTRPDILYPTRYTTIKKIVRPILSRPAAITPSSVIESSESAVDDDFIRPTEVLGDSGIPTLSHNVDYNNNHHEASMITPTLQDSISLVQATHHAGNEIKISDEVIPTKTEFRTTVVTLTKTLSEPPLTVSSIGYVNLTHTLTVTHTKTSLVSQSEGAITQTLVLTNTHTSTIVDVVTEIHTKVQPTTIIETVTKHIPIPQVQPTPVEETMPKTKVPLDDITMSSEEDNLIIRDNETTENVQKIDTEEGDSDSFFVVMNKSQNGGQVPPVNTEIETGDFDVTRNEQVNSNGVSQVLFGEILLAGTPYLETNVHLSGFGKECQPDCKASRNERCQRIDGLMKCVCRPGFARMFPDRPCKPTYTYSVKLALGSKGNERLQFQESLSDNSSKQYQALAADTHEGINRMVMQSDLRDVFHGIHINGFRPVEIKDGKGDQYKGVLNDFYVQLSDNAHESRLKEVIEKYLRTNNYSLGGTNVHAASELMNKLDVSDFDECKSGQFHDCSEHAQCFNLRGTYTCSCLEGFADLSVNTLYPGRICSAEPVGCERCNYHGSCYSRDDQRVLCECFQWYAGSKCQVNLKVVLISLVVVGALLTVVLAVCAVVACSKKKPVQPPKRSIVACIQSMPSLHQGAIPSKQRADRRALINERESGDNSSVQNASLPYMPAKRVSTSKKCIMSDPPAHDPPPPPAPAVMIPRARLLHHQGDSRENVSRKRSQELSSEAKLISYLESGAIAGNDEMRRKHSLESSYSANKDRHNKQGALVSAGFKVSTTVRPDDCNLNNDRDDLSSLNKNDLEAELRFDSLRRKSYSQDDNMSEWTDAERRIGELTLSEARSVGGTLPASTGRAASSTRLTHQEANTMAERDLGSTFLLPHVHLYKPDLTSDVSEFDSL